MFNISNGEETLVTTDSEYKTADFSELSAVNEKQLCNTTITADEAPYSETVFVVSVGRVMELLTIHGPNTSAWNCGEVRSYLKGITA